MTNNDILRRLRYSFDFDDTKMMALFELGGTPATRAQISDWLKPDDHDAYQNCPDRALAVFLNGLIIERRGRRDGPPVEPENRLNNNIVLNKLKIALNLKAEDVLAILDLADFRLSKHELSAFFRKPNHKHFRECKDQVLRNFLQGMQAKLRP